MSYSHVRPLGVPGWDYRVDSDGDIEASGPSDRGAAVATITSPRGVFVMTKRAPVPIEVLEAVLRLRREQHAPPKALP